MRARLALHVSGRRCVLREIVLRDKAAAFLAASPKGTVPVLVMPDGGVIEESLEIMLWALDGADPEQWLVPPSGDLAAMLGLVEASDTGFKADLDAYKYASRGTPEAALAARAHGAQFLLTLDGRLSGQRYLFGDRLALADMAIFPFVRQFANVDRQWFDGEAWPCLRRWLDELLASPRFAAVMKKYPKWQPGDDVVLFG